MVLAVKHLSDFAEMQPVREPVAILDAMDIELAFHRHASRPPPARRLAAEAMGERHDPCSLCDLDLERRHVQMSVFDPQGHFGSE
jgi:hypothetical protein